MLLLLLLQTGCVQDCGCVSSPELPTAGLFAIGFVACGAAAWLGNRARRRDR